MLTVKVYDSHDFVRKNKYWVKEVKNLRKDILNPSFDLKISD